MTTFKIASAALAAAAIFSPAALADTHKHHSTHVSSVFAKEKAFVHKKSFTHKKTNFAKHKPYGKSFNKSHRAKAFQPHKFNNHKYSGHKFNGHKTSHSSFQTVKLERHALASCSTQLRHDAYKFGYKGVRLTDADVKQVGKDKFIVHAGAKLYDGYSFSHQPYECTVKHGKVVDAFKPKKLKF